MRITVDIDDDVMARLLKVTKETKKSSAIGTAVNEFLKARELKNLVWMAMEGKVDYPMTNEELEANQYGDD